MTSAEHDSAVERLHAGLVEQDRLSERYDAAVGTSTELGAYVRLGAAGDQVAAREAWLHWIDDEGYRGLGAGPFELLAESRAAERRDELHRAEREQRLLEAITVRCELATRRVDGRAWLNGREVGGTDPRFSHLEGSHD